MVIVRKLDIVCNLIGIEVGKHFRIDGKDNIYKMSEMGGIYVQDNFHDADGDYNQTWVKDNSVLIGLINEELQVE